MMPQSPWWDYEYYKPSDMKKMVAQKDIYPDYNL